MTPYLDAGPYQQREIPFWSYLDVALLVGLILPCLLGASVVTQLLAVIIPPLAQAKVWLSMGLFYVLWFGALYLVLKVRYYDEPFGRALAWIYPRRGLALAIFSGPFFAILMGILGALLRTPMVDLPIKKLLHGQLSLALFGVFSVILGPVTEELAFRGFFMPLLVRSYGPAAGIVLTAIPFGLLHGAQYGWLWQYIVLVSAAGALFGVVRQYTGSTLASAAMHSSYNLTFFVAYIFGTATL